MVFNRLSLANALTEIEKKCKNTDSKNSCELEKLPLDNLAIF